MYKALLKILLVGVWIDDNMVEWYVTGSDIDI